MYAREKGAKGHQKRKVPTINVGAQELSAVKRQGNETKRYSIASKCTRYWINRIRDQSFNITNASA